MQCICSYTILHEGAVEVSSSIHCYTHDEQVAVQRFDQYLMRHP